MSATGSVRRCSRSPTPRDPLSPAGVPVDVDAVRERLVDRLVAARNASVESTVFQLIDGFPDIDRLKTNVFRGRVRYRMPPAGCQDSSCTGSSSGFRSTGSSDVMRRNGYC